MREHDIAVVPGDGIGPEVMPHAWEVLEAAARLDGGFRLTATTYPWGCDYSLQSGTIMPPDGAEQLARHDAIFFVAAGNPLVDDYRSAWELIFVMRKRFHQYACVRPVRSFPGVPTLLGREHGPIDMVIVRENSEGEYAGPGGVVHAGDPGALAVQVSVMTRFGVERIARYAFDLARRRRRRVTNVTKSNALLHGLVFWDEVVDAVAAQYPDVDYDRLYVDAASMRMVQRPEDFDVVVSTNLFGDILSDLAGAVVGSIGLCPSANLNPERSHPSMFEPVHGSAPDIAGKGIANPIATILAGADMLEHLGEAAAAVRVRDAVGAALHSGVRSRDLGGSATTAEVAEAVAAQLAAASR